jgi:hypothetical protein
MRARDSRVLVKGDGDLRRVARTFVEQGEHRGLVAAGTADTHLHALLATHREAAGRFAHDVETSLSWRLGLRCAFEPARFEPIRSQLHYGTSFWYILDNARKHGLSIDPAYDGTCLPELLGARVTVDGRHDEPRLLGRGIGRRVAVELPRVRGRSLVALVGGEEMLAGPLELEDLATAIAASVGEPALGARNAAICAAQCAAAHVASEIGATALARIMQVTPRCVHRYRRRRPVPEVEGAVRLQWHLRGWLRRRHQVVTATG